MKEAISEALQEKDGGEKKKKKKKDKKKGKVSTEEEPAEVRMDENGNEADMPKKKKKKDKKKSTVEADSTLDESAVNGHDEAAEGITRLIGCIE